MQGQLPPTYQAAVLESPGKIAFHSQPMPDSLEPGEALLQVRRAAVCGTDISIYRGDYQVPLPLVLGHEFSAQVVDLAPGLDRSLLDKKVVCEINNTCLAYGRKEVCEACRRGLPNHCTRRTVLGIVNSPGAFAQYVRVPAGSLHVLPEEISLDCAVLVEPLAAAIRTFELTPIQRGDLVVVLGCGRLGRLTALVAHKLGARVVTVARSEASLELVAPFSFKQVLLAREPKNAVSGSSPSPSAGNAKGLVYVDSAQELRSAILEWSAGLGADVVVEATGNNNNLGLARNLVRPLGTIALKSTSGLPVAQFDTTGPTVDEIRFQGSRCGPFDKAIAFMRTHGLPDQTWITARFGLEQTQQALEAAMHEPKVLIEIS